jgi:quercetin dioxygenase-like cupin family protein
MEADMAATIIGPADGKFGDLGTLAVRFLLWSEQSGGTVSVVEHPIPPKALVAPLHRHSREDEYSFVLEGTMGAQLGEEVVTAHVGDFVFKPRHEWHTFWNPADEPCRILEIISPGGFEHFFEELVDRGREPDPPFLMDLGSRYGIEFDVESIPRLCAEHRLWFNEVTIV